jgi:phospholipid transport system substrate-binding protein
VRQSGTEPVTLDYSMEKTGNGWKVYDVTVGGVSLVTTYRESFAAEVRNAGVDGLIRSLVEKNRQLETKPG